MAPLRAGLVGIGMMGRNHARVLSSLEGVNLVAVADPSGDKHQAAGDAQVVGTVGEMIEAGIDLAVVAVPTAFHLDAGLELAAAGVHTLVEKPLATDGAEALALCEAFERPGWSMLSGTSNAATPPCWRSGHVSRRVSWARSTRSPRGDKVLSRTGSPTLASSKTSRRTTSI